MAEKHLRHEANMRKMYAGDKSSFALSLKGVAVDTGNDEVVGELPEGEDEEEHGDPDDNEPLPVDLHVKPAIRDGADKFDIDKLEELRAESEQRHDANADADMTNQQILDVVKDIHRSMRAEFQTIKQEQAMLRYEMQSLATRRYATTPRMFQDPPGYYGRKE